MWVLISQEKEGENKDLNDEGIINNKESSGYDCSDLGVCGGQHSRRQNYEYIYLLNKKQKYKWNTGSLYNAQKMNTKLDLI